MIKIKCRVDKNNEVDGVYIECVELKLDSKIDLYYLTINLDNNLTPEDIIYLIDEWNEYIKNNKTNNEVYIPFQVYDECSEFIQIKKLNNNILIKLAYSLENLGGGFYDYERVSQRINENKELVTLENEELVLPSNSKVFNIFFEEI